MSKKRRFMVVLTFLFFLPLLFLSVIKYWQKDPIQENKNKISYQDKKEDQEYDRYHNVGFVDRELFFKSIGELPKTNTPVQSIKGGIIPHHLLASFMIADFFNRLSNQDIKTIILIGPNHYERGNFKVLTSEYVWKTPFGFIDPDENIINNLKSKKLIATDEKILEKEHSITGILPFIKYYLPEVKIVPLILMKEMNEKDTDMLSSELRDYLENQKSILVASVDFSHNLSNFQTKEKDLESLAAIRKNNYGMIFGFGNEHFDSPASIALLLKSMERIQVDDLMVLNNTNSGELTGDNFSMATSYFSLFFH